MALSAAICVRAQQTAQQLMDDIKRSDIYEWAEAAGNPQDRSFDRVKLQDQALSELARKINGAVVRTVSHTRYTEQTEDFESHSEIRTSAIFKSIKTLEISKRNQTVIFVYVDKNDIISLRQRLSSGVKDYIVAAGAAERRGDMPEALHLYCCAYTVVKQNPYIDFPEEMPAIGMENDDAGLWIESNINRILSQFDIKFLNIEQQQGKYPYLITLQCTYCGSPAQNITLNCGNGYMPRSVTDDRGQVLLYMEGLRNYITVGIECMRDDGETAYDPRYVDNLPASRRVISLSRTGVAYNDYTIKSIPRGAAIRIDGSAAGYAPLERRLTAEYHNIEAEYGGRTLHRAIDLAREAEIPAFDFRQKADISVYIKRERPGRADITIDNRQFVTDPDLVVERSLQSGTSEQVPVGRYRLTINGYYKSRTEQIDVGAGTGNSFSYPYPRRRGQIGISVIPQLTYSSSTLGYGGMIICRPKNFPVAPYVKYTSTFNGGFVDDNPLPEEQYEALTGIDERYSAMSVTAGVQIPVGRSGGPYAGFGYGHRQHIAQFADAVYYNADSRFRSADFELGYVFRLGRGVRLSAGINMPAIWLGSVGYYGGDMLLHMIKGAWRSTVYVFTLGWIFDPFPDDVIDYSSFINRIAPRPKRPFHDYVDRESEWGTFRHPYNFIEFNIGLGFTF